MGWGYRAKTNRPFSKDTVRFMLPNQTYIGKVRCQQTTIPRAALVRARPPYGG